MHKTAMEHGKLFFDTYVGDRSGLRIVEIGAQDVNGSIRTYAAPGNEYVGVDFVETHGVDVVLEDPYRLPFDDGSFDVCVTSSCMEHSEFFWLLFLEIMRIVKPTGVTYINVPSNGVVHQWPVDCWRFYPDSGLALQNWANRNGMNVALLESFIGRQRKSLWNDFVAVFAKDAAHAGKWDRRMVDSRADFGGERFSFTNARLRGQEGIVRFEEVSEDQEFRPFRQLIRWAGTRTGRFWYRR